MPWYSQGSGLWSTLSNWNSLSDGSGVQPSSIADFNNQAVTIQTGHVIEFDVEDSTACDGSISGWTTGIAGITIQGAPSGGTPGELTLTRTPNNADRVYCLRLKADTGVVGTSAFLFGRVTGGSESNPIPSSARHVVVFIDPPTTGGFNLTYLQLALYASQPRETVYVLTQAAPIGATVLNVQGRLTGCNPNTDTAEWRVGRGIVVVRVDPSLPGSNADWRTIVAVGDGTITLSSGLSSSKAAGSYVVLTQRNIDIRDMSTSTTGQDRVLIRYGTGAVLDCSLRRFPSTKSGIPILRDGSGHILDRSGVASGGSHYVLGGSNHIIRGSAVVVSCGLVMLATVSPIQAGDSVVCGMATLWYQCANVLVHERAVAAGAITAYRCDTADDSVFSYITPLACNNIVDTNYKLNVAPTVWSSRTEIWPPGYAPAGTGAVDRRQPQVYIPSEYVRVWCNGGRAHSQTSVVPNGHNIAGEMVFEQHSSKIGGDKNQYCWNWVAYPFTVGSGEVWTWKVNLRKTVSFSGYPETPIVEIVNALYDGANMAMPTPVATYSMIDNQNTWQEATLTASTPGTYWLRIRGRHDTGSLYYTVLRATARMVPIHLLGQVA